VREVVQEMEAAKVREVVQAIEAVRVM